MKEENLSTVITGIGDKYVDEAAMYTPTTTSQKPKQIKWIALAASLVLIINISIFTAAFITETRAYNKAITYIENAGISSEGLDRSEVKSIYRDLVFCNTTNNKTLEIIFKSR